MRQRRRRPASSLQPEIRDRIERLAFSWPLQQARGVRCPAISSCPDYWQNIFEETYGEGKGSPDDRAVLYSARLAELNSILLYRPAGADLEATVRILETALQAEEHHARDMQHRARLRPVDLRRASIRKQIIETYQGLGADGRLAREIMDRGLAHLPGLNGTFPFPTGDHRLDKIPRSRG